MGRQRFITKIVKPLILFIAVGCLHLVTGSSILNDYHSPFSHVDRLGGLSALHLAAADNRLDDMAILLQSGNDINARSPDGSTALHTAAANGNLQMVSLILQSENALVNPKNNALFTPLVLAERSGHAEIASLLRASTGNISIASLRDSAINGRLDEVKSLILRGANVNGLDSYNFTALHKAASYDFLEMAKFLVDHGADLTIRGLGGQIPLFEAAVYGKLDIVVYLVEKGSEILA